MSKNESDELSREDRDLLASVRDQYAPPARSASRRIAFRQAVEDGLQPTRRAYWPPVLAAAAVAAVAVLLVLPGEISHPHVLSDLAFDHLAVNRIDHDIMPKQLVILADVLEL